jgi:hypothetical protein
MLVRDHQMTVALTARNPVHVVRSVWTGNYGSFPRCSARAGAMMVARSEPVSEAPSIWHRCSPVAEPENTRPSAEPGVEEILPVLGLTVVKGRPLLDKLAGHRMGAEVDRGPALPSLASLAIRSLQVSARFGRNAATPTWGGLRL